jgi:pimeloyl-[acyl-carrier protein] synthase
LSAKSLELSGYEDLLAPDIIVDPYPVYDIIRDADPVHWNARLDAWLLLGYSDVLDALNDHELFSSDRTAAFMSHATDGADDRFRDFAAARKRMLLYTDPPRHTRLRQPVQHGMSPRLVNRMRPRIQQIADDLVDAVIEQGKFDAIQDIGYRLPVIVNSELIGIPAADRDTVKNWTEDFIAAINAGGANVPIADLERGQNAVRAMRDYFLPLAERKRAEPAEDLLSALVGRQQNPLAGDDLVSTCIVLLFAGLETALNLIGNGLLALLRNPDQLDRLRAEPDLDPTATEELLRYDGPLHLVGRMATRDVTIRDRTIKQGDKVLLMLGAANRDGSVFASPHKLDITRTDNKHLAFSHGVHYCPGSELSRILGQTTFRTILDRMADLRHGVGDLEWQPNLSFRGLKHLPLEFTAGPRKAARR